MKRYSGLLPITLCASVFLHAGIFLFFAVNYSESLTDSPEPAPAVFSLVNIAVLPDPLVPEPPVPVPEFSPEDQPAEIFIPVEEIPPDSMPVAAAVSVRMEAAVSTGPAAVPSAAGTGNNAALTGAYIQRNFSYIQRRIRDRLVYPSQAKRAGIQGVAEVTFTIHMDGTVSGVTIRVTSSQDILDQAAIAAVHAAAPFPSPPIPARIAIPIAFRLR